MTTYSRGTEGRLNDILTVLGTTNTNLWPFWESQKQRVHGVQPGVGTPKDGTAAVNLEDEFSPALMPSGLYSYVFHKTDDNHILVGDQNRYSYGNGTADEPFSVGAWIRPTDQASLTIMSKYDSAGGAEEWQFFIDSSKKLSLELHDASASASEIAASDTALTAFQWQFVVATYDGTETAPDIRLYVNGTLDNDGSSTETGSYVAMENTATPLLLGSSGVTATPVDEFHGRMALPFVCGKELTAAEVTTLYGYMAPMVGLV